MLEPSRKQAASLTAEINRRLAGSLRYVFSEAGSSIGLEPARVESWIAGIEAASRPDPLVHVLFHTLVAELQIGNYEGSRAVAERLLKLGAAGSGLRVVRADPGSDGPRAIELFARFADLEEANRLDLVAPDNEEIERATPLIEQGLALLARNDPEQDGELRAFLSDILLVGQKPGHLFTAAAASCFQNWGALLLVPATQRDALDIVELLAHEATHLLLFALALDEPLLTNPPDQLHFSPLREAPRSMDGVYHATMVSARIVRALVRQANAPEASGGLREIALERAARAARTYDDGVEVIEKAAELTGLGGDILVQSKEMVGALRPHLLATA
jgi:HEXXH motif-containing protein